MQNKALLIITLILSILLAGTTVVFAWFTVVEKTQKILIYSGSVKTEANLYEISSGIDVPIINSYEFNEVVPNQTFDFRLDVTNQGTLDANLTIIISFENNNVALLDFFNLKYGSNNITMDSNHSFVITPNLILGKMPNEPDNGLSFNFSVEVSDAMTIDDITNDNNYLKIKTIEIILTQVGDN